MMPEQQLADVFLALARGATRDPTEVTGTLSVLASRSPSLLGVDAAAVTCAPDDREKANMAGSRPEVCLLEHEAVERCEGPAHDCRHEVNPPASTPSLTTAEAAVRWPFYTPRAVALGFTQVAALPLRGLTKPIGALVLLSSGPADAFSPGMLTLGQSMADFTALTLERALEADQSRTLAAQLERALTSRILIEQAKGVLSSGSELSMDDAFHIMRAYARSHRRSLNEVAREVIAGRPDPELTELLDG
ncbi:ANTAR domain-containing protein [Streptomyces sp. NPDC087300]|uniref:ANTAR domain-containing protein n=1 Tax=Streptomyces sp. NPDC087300 TaxID=3365780 RepID=UPI00381910F1